MRSATAGVLVVCALGLGTAPPAAAIDVGFNPQTRVVALAEVFDYDILVPASPDTFNAFEFTIVYDPARLTFIQRSPTSLQVGPLMTAACPNGFHLFSAVADTIRITYSMLCAGASVTGPGVVYRLRFRAASVSAITDVRFVKARFADEGVLLFPVVAHDGRVEIGDVSAAPDGGRDGASILGPAFPSPFRAEARLGFTAGADGPARLSVLGSDGREVRVLFDGALRAGGGMTAVWDGRDERGARVAAGVYFMRLRGPDGVRAARVVLLP